jgi:competence protein ComFC
VPGECSAEAFEGAITESFSCANCAHRELFFECAVSAYRSRGLVRKIIHAFKYSKQIHLRFPVADWLGETLDDPRLSGRRFDIVVPVPLHPTRERERGWNHCANVLA